MLPFDNLSGDPEQGYFVDGMVEEIITALSRIRWLFAIARNSSFTYKGRAVDVKQVGRARSAGLEIASALARNCLTRPQAPISGLIASMPNSRMFSSFCRHPEKPARTGWIELLRTVYDVGRMSQQSVDPRRKLDSAGGGLKPVRLTQEEWIAKETAQPPERVADRGLA